MALLPKIKLKSITSFPSNVYGGDGIDVSKEHGNYTIDMDWGEFSTQTAIPTSPTNNVLTYDTATDSYIMIPSQLLGGAVAGISDALVDGFQYGRQNAGWTRVPTASDVAALVTLAGISPAENIYYPACDITGATDSGPIIQAAVAAAEAAGAGLVQLPATGTGKILINTSVIISRGSIHIKGYGYEEFKGYQSQFTPQRGTAGTYVHTSALISPFIISAAANGCKISDMAFTQDHPISGPGWTPIAYPPCIDHGAGDQPNYSSAGSLEVFNVLFAGVARGILAGTMGAGALTSKFTGRDYYHHIKGTIFGIGIQINASSDILRLEDIHFWPGFHENSATHIIDYIEENAMGIISLRNDNCMMSNVFCYGFKYGLRLYGGSPDGITQGMQISNLNCDHTHVGIFIDNVPTGTGQFTLSVTNYSHTGIDPAVSGDYAIWMAANVNNTAVTIVNASWNNYAGPAALIQGTSNELTLINARAFTYSQFPSSNSAFVTAEAGNAAYLYGRFRVANVGSSPGLGNAPYVIDNSDGPASSWISYTPTVTVTGGTATATGRSKTINHVTTVTVTITVTAGGTFATFSLPAAASGTFYLTGREMAATGKTWVAQIGGAMAAAYSYDNTNAVTTGWVLSFSGSYESA